MKNDAHRGKGPIVEDHLPGWSFILLNNIDYGGVGNVARGSIEVFVRGVA